MTISSKASAAQEGLVAARSLTLPVAAMPGESLIGLIARAARLNVLGNTTVILEDVGITLLHPGTVGQDIGDKVKALAAHLGCPADDVSLRCHPYLGDQHGPQDVRWGDGALFRPDLVVEWRRVSPASLKLADYHRAAWMNKLLPYCPESLERLIDSCQACGRKLKWRRAWGIGFCDHQSCRHELSCSNDETLRCELVENYRRFAAIVSSDPGTRAKVMAGLHDDLQCLPASVLLNLTLQLGASVRPDPIKMHRNTLHMLPADTLASIVSQGARLLDQWPRALRGEITQILDGIPDNDGSGRKRFITHVRKLADRKNRPEQNAIVRAAIPEAREHVGVALASLSKPVVNSSDAVRMIGIDPAELRALRDANLISHRKVVGDRRVLARYDQAEVTKLASAWRGSVPASRLEQALGIPRYATEQLICLDEIANEMHPAVAFLSGGLRLQSSEVERYMGELCATAQPSSPPEDAVSIWKAFRRFGGRLKPWGALLAALREGRLPFWIQGRGAFTRSALVSVADRWKIDGLDFDEGDWPAFSFSDRITQVDANDILNLDSLQVRPVVAAGELTFTPSGVALLTDRETVLELSRRSVAVAEIAARLQADSRNVPKFMATYYPEVRKGPAGWDRAQFEKALPNLQ